MSAQQKAASIRAALQAIGSGAFVSLTTWAATDESKVIIIAAGTAFLGALGIRGVAEGQYDAHRDAAGDVRPGDVGASARTRANAP